MGLLYMRWVMEMTLPTQVPLVTISSIRHLIISKNEINTNICYTTVGSIWAWIEHFSIYQLVNTTHTHNITHTFILIYTLSLSLSHTHISTHIHPHPQTYNHTHTIPSAHTHLHSPPDALCACLASVIISFRLIRYDGEHRIASDRINLEALRASATHRAKSPLSSHTDAGVA